MVSQSPEWMITNSTSVDYAAPSTASALFARFLFGSVGREPS